MSGALSKNLLWSFFLPLSTSRIKEPITWFCALKCFTSLNKSSIEFWFFITFFEMGSSLCLKVDSFSLLFVTYKSISLVSLCQTCSLAKDFFCILARRVIPSCCWKSVSCEKSIPSSQSCKMTQENCRVDCSVFLFPFFMYSIAR